MNSKPMLPMIGSEYFLARKEIRKAGQNLFWPSVLAQEAAEMSTKQWNPTRNTKVVIVTWAAT
jgi:hypothetical protein